MTLSYNILFIGAASNEGNAEGGNADDEKENTPLQTDQHADNVKIEEDEEGADQAEGLKNYPYLPMRHS